MNKLIKIFLLLSIPIVAFPQYRSVVITIQLKTSDDSIPSLFYMLHDSVIYDLGKGKEGFYEECIPAKMVNTDAAFAIQVDDKWKKIATVGQLEEQGICSNGKTTLTLLEIKRILFSEPDDPREYKTPPKPYRRALLSEDGLPFTGTNWDSYQLLLVASSVADSLFCSVFLPKQAFDGTYYTVDSVIEYPKASCMNKTMDCFSVYFSEYYLQCEDEEDIKPDINDMTFIIDENGVVRGVFCFVEKEKMIYGKNVAKKVFNRFKNERFHPAKDVATGKPVPDMVELYTSFSKTYYSDSKKEKNSQLNDMLIECIEDYRNKYESSPYLKSFGRKLYLCVDGLPNPHFGYNRTIYDHIPLETISLNNSLKGLEKEFDLLRVTYYLRDNTLEICVSMSTVTRKRKQVEITLWAEDVESYTYRYSCLTQQWGKVTN